MSGFGQVDWRKRINKESEIDSTTSSLGKRCEYSFMEDYTQIKEHPYTKVKKQLTDVCYWSNAGARFYDVVTWKPTVALYQPMPGLEKPDRKRLLPVRDCWSQPTFSEADRQS